jgi:hypothetical protein
MVNRAGGLETLSGACSFNDLWLKEHMLVDMLLGGFKFKDKL